MEGNRAAAAALGVRVAGLAPQWHLEDWGVSGMTTTQSGISAGAQTTGASFSRMYTFWANPADRSDPANLAVLDENTRSAMDVSESVALPEWIERQRQRIRYPSLWEAVHTHWLADGDAPRDPAELLRHHVDYVLHNQFRDEYGIDPLAPGWNELVSPAAVQQALMNIDGVALPGFMIDTDAFVFGIGAPLADGRVVTAVIDRSFLSDVRVEFVSDGDQPGRAPGDVE